jgi:hypothetical protein
VHACSEAGRVRAAADAAEQGPVSALGTRECEARARSVASSVVSAWLAERSVLSFRLDVAFEDLSAASWLVIVGTAASAAAERSLTRPSPKPTDSRMATERMVAVTLRLFSARRSIR